VIVAPLGVCYGLMMLSMCYIPLAMVFAQPFWLVGMGALCAPILLVCVARRRGRQVARLSVILQCAAIVLLVGALAGPSVWLPQGARAKWLVLNDVSASTRTQQSGDSLPPEITPRLDYIFARGVAPAGREIGADQTDLADALRLAGAQAGELAGVIIRTDGNFTGDYWPAAAASLARDGLPVAIVPLNRPPLDVRIAEFTARRVGGRKVRLRLSVVSNAITESLVEIPGLLKREIKFLPHEPVTISIDAEVPEDRGATFTASLGGDDAFSENDRSTAGVGPVLRRVAVIGSPGKYKPATLGMPADILTPEQFDSPLDNYAAVLLIDDTGGLLSPGQRKNVAGYVRSGGGLVLLGAGPHQSPGDRDDPLNQAAALVPNPYDRKPIELTVALDASGSMGQTAQTASGELMKFDQAAQAVLTLKRHLTDRDTLRVIVFSDRAREVYSSGAGRPDFAKLAAAMGDVKPTGATNVFPALELASKISPSPKRHGLLIIVSDLQTEKFDPPRAAEMLKKATLDLAIVAIAAPSEAPSTEPLETLKTLLDAPLEKRDQLSGLARIFVRFLGDARGGAIRRGQFTIRAKDASPLAGKSTGAYIVSAPHDDADVMLEIGDDALAARRRVGLGRSVSIALAGGDLLGDADMESVLASSVKWAARTAPDLRFDGRVERTGSDAIVSVTAIDSGGAPINMLKLFVRTLLSSGQADTTAMQQTSPGRYAAKFPIERLLSGLDVVDAAGRVVWRGGLRKTYPLEFDAIGPNNANLQRLASLTGGRVVSIDELSELARNAKRAGRLELWYWLAALALAMMLIDWIISRTIRSAVSRT
jgi:hypothetical protein